MFDFRILSFVTTSAVLIALTGCSNSHTNSTSTSEAKSSHHATSETTPSTTTESSAASEKDTDLDYMVSLGLMKGHLTVAKELLDAGKPDQAIPHIGHPVEEIYADLESELPARNVPEFKTTLNQLHDLVKSTPKDPKVATQYEASIKAVDTAIAAVPETKRQSPQFVLEVINGLLDTAKEEYEAAIADGKIAEAVEYQDSRGFVFYADTLYQGIAPSMGKDNPKGMETIKSSFTQLKKAWPSAVPPVAPVMTIEQVSQPIEEIRRNS
jgi:hypothetical protein